MHFNILEPIWSSKSIGLNEAILKQSERMTIDILYINRQGFRSFPSTYSITKEKALQYPTQKIKGVRLRIIPIADLDIVQDQTERERPDFEKARSWIEGAKQMLDVMEKLNVK